MEILLQKDENVVNFSIHLTAFSAHEQWMSLYYRAISHHIQRTTVYEQQQQQQQHASVMMLMMLMLMK